MAQRDKPKESPLVLLLQCRTLASSLRSRGMRASSVRSLRRLTQPQEDLHARAIVLGPTIVREVLTTNVLPKLRELWPMVDLIVWAPRASGTTVRQLLRDGARDVILASSETVCANNIEKIVGAQKLLPRAARTAKKEGNSFEGLYSRSKKMWDLFDTAKQIAPTDATVLILGETGTGKELLARAVHRHSGRSGRFVPVNCGGVSEALIDSELFGHKKGAFTGASSDKVGLFSHADNGTLLLDEIGNVPAAAQYHLLRALQEGAIRPVGANEEIPVDVRVVAATSNLLEEQIEAGTFREDLFYRLDVIRLTIPALRDRPEDIIYLFAHFAKKVGSEYQVSRPDLHESFLDAMLQYDWPGNVRQLENFTERLVLTRTGTRVDESVFWRMVSKKREEGAEVARPSAQPRLTVDCDKPLEEAMAPIVSRLEREYLVACLTKANGRMNKAAEIAGLSRRTLLRKLNRYDIDRKRFVR